MPESAAAIRPTKRQMELLAFIEAFIAEHGYSPSYREIMTGLNYTSVATVSLHVNNLIRRGHLQKRDRSARSLEVVKGEVKPTIVPVKQLKTDEAKWLVGKIEIFFKESEGKPSLHQADIDQLVILLGALKILGLEGAASSFAPRLTELKNKIGLNEYVV